MLIPILLPLLTQPIPVALCHDGNEHDPDDVGAVAMAVEIIEAHPSFELVHLQHSTHIGSNNDVLHALMQGSVLMADALVVFDHWLEPQDTEVALAREIARGPLFILQGGPWEAMFRSFDLAPPETHLDVVIYTHSGWNDDHDHVSGRNRADFEATYPLVTIVDIPDQNFFAFNSPIQDWEWLRFKPETKYVLERTKASLWGEGDMSDAGMAFALVTGITQPLMADVQRYFGWPN